MTDPFDAAVAALSRMRYGAPSSWDGPNPAGWHLPEPCSPRDASMHDNGINDAFMAVRRAQREAVDRKRSPTSFADIMGEASARARAFASKSDVAVREVAQAVMDAWLARESNPDGFYEAMNNLEDALAPSVSEHDQESNYER